MSVSSSLHEYAVEDFGLYTNPAVFASNGSDLSLSRRAFLERMTQVASTGWTIRLTWFRILSGCQFVVLYDLGKTLKSHNMERELRAMSGVYLDFGSRTSKKAIAVDGARWCMDLIAEAERDERLKAHGFRILHIRANELKNPFRVRAKVMKFLVK